MHPEKLNLWDRLFNRYRKTIRAKGTETWKHRNYRDGIEISQYDFERNYVEYTVTDRLTGSETIKKEYLD